MARHRVGNRYLSDEEYANEITGNWAVGLFFVGSLSTGFLLFYFIQSYEWPKLIKVPIILIPSIGVGIACSLTAKFVENAFRWAVFIGILSLVSYGIWRAL